MRTLPFLLSVGLLALFIFVLLTLLMLTGCASPKPSEDLYTVYVGNGWIKAPPER